VRAFFSYFYFCINVGALTSSATVPIVQATLGFAPAFDVAASFMALAMALFVSQRRSYRYVSTEGTIIDAFKTAALLLCGGNGPDDAYYQTLPAEITGNEDETAAVQRKEALLRDVSQTMKILPIFALLPIYWSLYDQQGSVWTLQATRMDLPFGLQPAQLNIVNPLQILLFIPVFDRTVYPFLERKGINVSPLNRMSWGMVLMALAFLVSGVVESTIQGREAAGGPKLSVLYQLPQITILSIGEIFLSITGLEYAYASSPVRLQTFVTAMYLATCGVGNALSGVLFSTVFVNMNRATIMFSCAALMVVNQRIFERVVASATITITTSRHGRHEKTGADVVEIELGNGVTSVVDDRY
jgi:proton-dependent oligopeptide transporter, POT family